MQAFELSADNKPAGPSPLYSRGRRVHDIQRDFETFSNLPQSFYILFGPEEIAVIVDHALIWLLLCIKEL